MDEKEKDDPDASLARARAAGGKLVDVARLVELERACNAHTLGSGLARGDSLDLVVTLGTTWKQIGAFGAAGAGLAVLVVVERLRDTLAARIEALPKPSGLFEGDALSSHEADLAFEALAARDALLADVLRTLRTLQVWP